ncbi:hypothetical protein AVEN_111556-1, partial [Araneus ventricosus]
KVYYEYNVVESSQDPSPMEPFHENENEAEIQIYVKNPDIMNGDLYSCVGGLMGLWLGISVWTLVGIAEKSLRRSLRLRRKLSCKQEYVVKC